MEKKKIQFLVVFFSAVFFLFPLCGRAEKTKIRIIAEIGHIRLKPDLNSTLIREIPMGTVLESEAKEGSWFKINLPSKKDELTIIGFIQEDEVEILGEEIQEVEPISKIPLQQPVQPPPPARPSGSKFGMGFKLSGGGAYLFDGAGDLENLRKGRTEYYDAWEEENNYTSSSDWKKLSFIPDFNFDFIVKIGRNLGFGFGAGFIKANSKGNYSRYYDYINTSIDYLRDIDEDYARDYRLTAIALKTNFYFFLPVKILTFYGYAGIGYYIGTLTNDYTYDYYYYYESPAYSPTYKHEEIYEWIANEDSTCNTLGFQGGFGLEVKIASFLFFGVEFFGRWANFKDWEGTRDYSWEDQDRYWSYYSGWYSDTTDNDSGEYVGKLWVYDLHSSTLGKSYTNMWICEDKPSGSDYSNVRQAEINLNTGGILFSIRIHFDLF
jgi:hypothetical protein